MVGSKRLQFVADQLLQGLALEEGHNKEGIQRFAVAKLAPIGDSNDIRMLQLGKDRGFFIEKCLGLFVGTVEQDLYRDIQTGVLVVGTVDLTHTAMTNLPLN